MTSAITGDRTKPASEAHHIFEVRKRAEVPPADVASTDSGDFAELCESMEKMKNEIINLRAMSAKG